MRIDDEVLNEIDELLDEEADEAGQEPSALATFVTDAIVFLIFLAVLITGVLAVGV